MKKKLKNVYGENYSNRVQKSEESSNDTLKCVQNKGQSSTFHPVHDPTISSKPQRIQAKEESQEVIEEKTSNDVEWTKVSGAAPPESPNTPEKNTSTNFVRLKEDKISLLSNDPVNVPDVQKDDSSRSSDEASAEAVYDALSGYTSYNDSKIIFDNFIGKGKISCDYILRLVAVKDGSSRSEIIKWLHKDMVNPYWDYLYKYLTAKNAFHSPDAEAAQDVYDALYGATSSDDSTIILMNLDKRNKASTDNVIHLVAEKGGASVSDIIELMYDDLVSSDWKKLYAHLVTIQANKLEKAIAIEVNSYLSGYTSDSNSNEIYKIFVGDAPVKGDLLAGVLIYLEVENGNKRNEMAEFLFGDLTLTDAHRLSLHFFNSGNFYAVSYASYWYAYKVKDLIAGYTGIEDSRSIVKNFEKVPSTFLTFVWYELETLTIKEWGEEASKSLMDDMQQEDYEKLRVLLPKLPVYNPETSWLGWTWDKIMIGYDYLEGLVEYIVCGIVGIIIGILSVIGDLIVMVGDIFIAAKNILGMIVYYISGGSICRGSKESVFEFFTGISEFFGAPGTAISKMWNELTLEASLIEGPFRECQLAIFWTRRFANLIVNIILILVAGYGAVKLVIESIEGIAALVQTGKLLSALKSLPSKLSTKIKGLPSSVSKSIAAGVSKVIGLIKNPTKIIASTRNAITAVRLAANDEGYFNFLRKQVGKAIEKESTYWKERKEFWKKGSEEVDINLGKAEDKLTIAVDNVVDDPAKAEALVLEAEQDTQVAEKKASELMDDVNGKTEGKPAIKPITPETEAWLKGVNAETRVMLEADPELRRFWYEMDPDVRRALTFCNTPCIPLNVSPENLVEIGKLMNRLKLPPDHYGLREYLHIYRVDQQEELSKALSALDSVKSVQDFELFLENKLILYYQRTRGVTIRRTAGGLWEYPAWMGP